MCQPRRGIGQRCRKRQTREWRKERASRVPSPGKLQARAAAGVRKEGREDKGRREGGKEGRRERKVLEEPAKQAVLDPRDGDEDGDGRDGRKSKTGWAYIESFGRGGSKGVFMEKVETGGMGKNAKRKQRRRKGNKNNRKKRRSAREGRLGSRRVVAGEN
ncbi:hypothetical protein PABG_11274 [Paracoccidioides brasiliensis Pb03]|nr:hypothetical protein PABG_11274 [Paracoccidioides brasiliensis Pb03]